MHSMLLWTLISSTAVITSAAREPERDWYKHCVPNAELYCRKKAEHQPDKIRSPEDEQVCRDAIVEACRTEGGTMEGWTKMTELGGNTGKHREERMNECRKRTDLIERCEALHVNQSGKLKEVVMKMCLLDAVDDCATDAQLQAGHIRLVIQTLGHPKGEGFNHDDEL